MKERLKKLQKQLAILLILCMVFAQLIMTVAEPVFAVEDNGVTITYVPSMLWGGLKQYVEYEMDGITYRTDWASSATNRLAWSRMTQEQRIQLVSFYFDYGILDKIHPGRKVGCFLTRSWYILIT